MRWQWRGPGLGLIFRTRSDNLTRKENAPVNEKWTALVTLYQSGAAMPEVMNLYDAKTQLSRLIDRATAGEDILIGRAGKPLVRLVPVDDMAPRQPGLLKGLTVPDALFDPLPGDELALWG